MKEEDQIRKGTGGFSSLFSALKIEETQWTKYKGEKGGHGFAAEDANTLSDKLRGRSVDKTGLSNELNGADRVVNGQKIQTKYYKTAEGSVGSGFDGTSGKYKYKNQLLEVPSDQYDKAVDLMKQKIKEGKVPGVSDPEKALDLVKKGDVTYLQARNIAKAGTIDSLWFDVKNQSVVCGYVLGISFVITYAVGIWNGLDQKQAFKNAFCNALKTGTVALIVGVSTQQLLRTSLGRSFSTFTAKISQKIVSRIYSTKAGKELIEKTASAILKKTLYGVAAKNTVIKLLRSNLVTGAITAVAFTIPDAYKTLSGRISGVQFSKNTATTVGGVAGGWLGATTGAAIGSAVPVVGTAIGTFIGAIIGGVSSAMATKKIADKIAPDDTEIMIETMKNRLAELAEEYTLTEEEFSKYIIPQVKDQINSKWLEAMYSYSGSRENINEQKAFIDIHFEQIFQKALQDRPKVLLPPKSKLTWLIIKARMTLFLLYLKTILRFFFIKKETV